MSLPEDHGPEADPRRRTWIVPDLVWAPIAVSFLLLAVGLIALAFGQPWMFPSLGPSAFLQAEDPARKTARFYNVVVGHLVGLASGIAAVLLLGASDTPGVLASGILTPIRLSAAALSAVLTMIGLSLLRAAHPPAAATMLLVALGGFPPTGKTASTILAGVLLLAILGEGVRYLRLHVLLPGPE
jgi:hypothetical protein